MSIRPAAKSKRDKNKSRAELVAELEQVRELNARLAKVVKRYELKAVKNDLYRSSYELDVEKVDVESQRNELREKQKEGDLQSIELEVQNEELNVQLAEINAQDSEVPRISEALRESDRRYSSLVNNGDDFMHGGGEMGALMRSLDWSKTPIGPVSSWSPALRTMVSLLLRNRFPIILWWGPQFVQFYNDAYRPITGDKHPKSMGQPASECWAEIWHIIGPMIEAPFSGGPATTSDDLFLLINRRGFLEETHFKSAYSPVPDDTMPGTGVGGVLGTEAEITDQIIGERQLRTLRELGARAPEAKTPEQACETAVATFMGNDWDVSFALFYLVEPGGMQARLAASCGFKTIGKANPKCIDLTIKDEQVAWPLKRVVEGRGAEVFTVLPEKIGTLPSGRWVQSPHTAIALPLDSPDQPHPYGVLIVGLSPHRELNDLYRSFLELAAGQVTTAIRNALAYQEERKRAETLAELDKAKTLFFSNVSHEFRTPLTLMLGPVEELLSRSRADLSPAANGQLELVHRNSMRLLRLVNMLLDFSRIEAGRVQAVYEPMDLANFTGELASVFRAAIEKAGLKLIVDCPPLPEPVYVDRDMWEKIVLNLLSNAFKFTFEGDIEVKISADAGSAVLSLRDTGVGIPEEEMPRLFERFHRIPNTRSRTHEGSGIGLALVQELVKLHGGTVRAESRRGKGTTFYVHIPLGKDHLPADRIGGVRFLASTAMGVAPFVDEALRWLPDVPEKPESELPSPPDMMPVPCPAGKGEQGAEFPKILIADDNADMRHYLVRLLAERYHVEAVPDGQVALAAAQERRPDLILSDVMMPHLDGLELVQRLRANPGMCHIPIILLSARAGEESRIQGMETGADDYLIKPFSARELLARVETHLELAKVRKEAKEALKAAKEQAELYLDLMGHDINNMHQIAMGYLEMAKDMPMGVDQTRYVEKSMEMLQRSAQLIGNVRKLQKLREGMFQTQSIDVCRVLVDVQCEYDKVEGKSVTLRMNGHDGCLVRANELLQDVFDNLVNNAVKHTGNSSEIFVNLDVVDDNGNRYCRVAVEDNGSGIPDDSKEIMFNRMYKNSARGMGLGLYLVKSVVTSYGGKVWVEDRVKGDHTKGARFVVLLPAIEK